MPVLRSEGANTYKIDWAASAAAMQTSHVPAVQFAQHPQVSCDQLVMNHGGDDCEGNCGDAGAAEGRGEGKGVNQCG